MELKCWSKTQHKYLKCVLTSVHFIAADNITLCLYWYVLCSPVLEGTNPHLIVINLWEPQAATVAAFVYLFVFILNVNSNPLLSAYSSKRCCFCDLWEQNMNSLIPVKDSGKREESALKPLSLQLMSLFAISQKVCSSVPVFQLLCLVIVLMSQFFLSF